MVNELLIDCTVVVRVLVNPIQLSFSYAPYADALFHANLPDRQIDTPLLIIVNHCQSARPTGGIALCVQCIGRVRVSDHENQVYR